MEGLQAAGGAVADVLVLEGVYLEAPIASRAIAAIEVIAAAAGQPGTSLPPEILRWLEAHPVFRDEELLANARQALDRILTESELQELWADSTDYDAWSDTLNELRGRLT
jgi:hypothetical protein